MFETISGPLSDGQNIYTIRLRLAVQELMVSESPYPVSRAITRVEATPGTSVKNGKYTLQYVFDGRNEESKVRVDNGMLLGG